MTKKLFYYQGSNALNQKQKAQLLRIQNNKRTFN